MIPDRQTLLAEVKNDKEGLIKIFEQRSLKELSEKRAVPQTTTVEMKSEVQPKDVDVPTPIIASNTGEVGEADRQNGSPFNVGDSPSNREPTSPQLSAPDRDATPPSVEESKDPQVDGYSYNQEIRGMTLADLEQQEDFVINPGRETVQEYLKSPLHSEDPNMTQIDILKSNSIEIFYNLLILLNNVNHSTIREFLCSGH